MGAGAAQDMKCDLPVCSLLVLSLLPAGLSAAQKDSRKVYVLYTGDPYPGVTPYIPMREDALIEVTPVQGSRVHYAGISLEDIRKALRIYMPRSYKQYLFYDVTILSDTNRPIFGPYLHSWPKDAVLDYGKGLLMVGGHESFGAILAHADCTWLGDSVMDVLPVKIPLSGPLWVDGGARIEVTPQGFANPFIASLPYKPLPEYMRIGTDGNIVIQKEGSTLLARWVSARYGNPPCYVTWDIGKGRTYAMMHDWTPGGGWIMSRWEYYGDYAINLMLYLAKRPLPADPLVAHKYRQLVHSLSVGKSTLYSLVDFVESFGGNARPVMKEMDVFDSIVKDAAEHYLNSDFSGALAKAQEANSKLKTMENLAIEVKNKALFWVYMVEWLSVLAVSLISGMLIWGLMVRRRMYKEVRTVKGITRRLDVGGGD